MVELRNLAKGIALFDQSIGKAIALCAFIFSWTHFAITDDAVFFFHILAPDCFLLFGSLLLPVKYRGFDWYVNVIGGLFTFSNLIDEFFGDPQRFQWNEYIFATITILIIIIRARKKNKLDKRTKHL